MLESAIVIAQQSSRAGLIRRTKHETLATPDNKDQGSWKSLANRPIEGTKSAERLNSQRIVPVWSGASIIRSVPIGTLVAGILADDSYWEINDGTLELHLVERA
ncbi:MAG: hypothetical protein EBZ06_05045, partial [Betaproteobacteria bacterium]|nr:hypothetical protein [Betaproteobacteria bacterium]